MPIYSIKAPDGKTYEIEGPAGAKTEDVRREVLRQHPMAAYTTEELEKAPSASGSFGNFGREVGQGVLSGAQSLTDLFGANNAASKYLTEAQEGLQKNLTPERQEEMRIEQELGERAKGDTLKELSTGIKSVLRHPLTSIASGLGSSVPLIAGTLLAPEAAPGAAVAGGIGALMGLGGQKGQNYQAVYDEAIKQGKSKEEAEKLGQAAAEYSLQNVPGLALGAGLGALEGEFAAPAKIARYLRPTQALKGATEDLVKPTFGKTLGMSTLEGGGTEFLQGSGAQVASNIALSQAGFDTPLFEGATGAGAHDALIGALTGAAVSPMQLSTLKREYDQQQSQKLEEEGKKKQAEQIQKEEEFKKNFGVQLALPAPAKEIQEKPTDLLQNPLGNFTADELGEERVKAIDAHREAAGKPRLNTYSIEDVVDAMPKENPEAERAALNELVANKANSTMGGYSNQKVSAQDVLNAATLKGVDTNTQGFKDFLTRATGLPSIGVEEKAATSEIKGKPLGLSELDMMTDAQRFVAQQSLLQLPSKEGETTILPKGTNATHYDQGQYLSALGAVDELHKDGKPATKEEALAEIKKASGLNRDQDAEYLLRDAIRRGDFDLNEKGEIVPAETASYLPEGHAIEEVTVGEGEAPENYTVKAGDRELKGSESKTEAEAQAKLERYQEIRANRSQEIEDEIAKKEEEVAKSREKLDNMEALGQGRSLEYQKAQAAHAELEAKTSKEIGDLNRDKALLDPELHPLAVKTGAVKPVKRKAFKLHKAKAGEAATQVGSYPTRQAAEQAITSNMSESELEDLAKDTRRRTLARRARQELNDRRTEKIKVRIEFKQVSGDIAKEFESFLAKIGLKGVGLKLMSTLGGSEGEYNQNLIKVALDVKNAFGVLRHESIHALKDLGFFSDNQWNALRRMAKDKWIKQFMKDVPYSEGVSRYDAYKSRFEENPPAGVTFQEYIEEEAIADAFRYFHENGTPPGMISAILKRLNQFFEALRNALNNGGFYTADDIFEKIEKGELVATKQGTAETKASLAPNGIPQKIWDLHTKSMEADKAASQWNVGQAKANATKATRRLLNAVSEYVGDDEQAQIALMVKMNEESNRRDEGWYGTTRFSLAKPSEENAWKADPAEIKKADAYEEKHGIRPYVSEGRLDLPMSVPRASLKTADKYGIDPILGIPVNKDGTVTVYYHTTKDQVPKLNVSKTILSEGRSRIYLTNESSGAAILADRGNMDHQLDGSHVLLNIHPSMLQVDKEYDGGRKDFYVPIAQGDFFNRKMNASGIRKSRNEAITEEYSERGHAERISKAIQAYKDADKKTQTAMLRKAKDVLKKEHNVGTLLSENGKLEKTRTGEFGVSFEGNSIASMGLGLASAQKITEKLGTCPNSAICEGLCLGETSGGNFLYGGAAKEDMQDIEKSAFRAGPRMMQYLKTEAMIIHPEEFAILLNHEITKLEEWSAKETERKRNPETQKMESQPKEIYQAAIRLNVTSDFSPRLWESIITSHPDTKFYDYTKLAGNSSIAENHHLTYSSTGFGQFDADGNPIVFKTKSGNYNHNWPTMRNRLDSGHGVAMAFSSKSALPKFLFDEETGKTYEVWNGDNYDARFVDPQSANGAGMIIGLKNKAATLKEKTATKETDGFFAHYDPKEGDTVTVPDQTQFGAPSAQKNKRSIPIARASLKAPDTPTFKRFFGDSKITDKNGEPMVMYHATNSDFNVFNRSDDGKLGEGIYSTSIPQYANEFAPQGNVMPLFVHAENPFVINVTRGEKAITERFSGDINKAMVKAVADFTDGKTRLMDLEGNQVRELFEKNGYDGIVVKDDQGNIVEANVFTPTQLKSAIGNTGAYSVSNPNIRYSLDQLTKGMSNPAAFQQRLNTVVSRREDVGHARRMIDALNPKKWGSFRREFLNRYDELAKVDKKLAKARGVIKLMADASAEAAALLSDMASSLAAQALGVEGKGGVPVFRNGYTSVDKTKKGAVEIFAPLAKYGPEIYSLYQFWAGAKRGRRLFREGREENYTAEDFKFAKELEQKYGTLFNSVQKDWLEYNNALVKYQVDTGVLSPARAAEYTKYSDYIPFYRQLDGEETVGPKLFQSMSGVKQSKVLKGGEVAIADFLETIVRNTQAAIQAGTKNVAAQLAVKNSMELGITEKTPVKAETFNTIRVFENGKETFYHTHDKLLLESMQGLNLPQLPFLGFFAAPANFLRNMVTKDPGFILANMMRDSVQAYVTSGADIVPFVDTVKHFGSAVAGKDPIIEKLKAAGLGGGHDFASDIERSGRDLAKKIRREAGAETKAERLFKPATSIWEFMERSTEASDLATRAAIYEKTLAETGNEAEAIYQALEVMNFYRKGANPLIRIASAVIPFLNARIQGLDVFYRSGIAPSFKSTNPTEADQMRQKVFFTRAAYVMALSCAYWALVHDDDDYKKQEQETKDNNWLIPELGIKIPTPFEVGFLFKVLPERAMQYFFGDDTGKDFGQAIKRGITSTFQLQFPQIIQPAVEASTNFSFFTGRAIVPPGLENVAPEFQVGPSTSKTFEVLGQSLGQSPIMLEHLWKGYTGTIGMYLVDVVDSVANMQSDSPKAAKRFEQMPFIKRFALDPEARGQVSSYYDLKNSVDEAVRTENLLEKTGNYEAMGEYITDNANLLATHDYILEMDKKMKELQQNAALIRNSGMDAESKKDILTAIGQAQNALTANVQYLKKLIRSQ